MNKLKQFLPVIILIAVGFTVYSFNLHNGLFWDDDDWIINNAFVHNITWDNIKFWFSENTLGGIGLKSNYYRPLLFLTFTLDYAISGIKPLVWHLTSNLLHIANGILVFSILYLALRKKLVAFLTTLVFLVHPLQTEAVTYISGRGDPLSVFFILLALWLFIKSEAPRSLRGSTSKGPEVEPLKTFQGSTSKHWIWLVGALLSMVLAILSRETAIIFPFLLVVVYIAFLSKTSFWRSSRQSIAKVLPYFAVVVVYGVLRLTILNFSNTLNFYQQSNIYSENLHVRLFTFMHVLADYVRLLIWPTGLHMERSMTVHTSLFQWPVYLVFTTLAAVFVFLIYLYRKERAIQAKLTNHNSQITNKSQAPNSQIQNPTTHYSLPTTHFSVWFFGIGWFFVGLAPVSGITPVNAILYEHWLYLPMIGFFFVAAFYLARLLNYLKSKSLNTCYLILATAIVVYFSFFGYQSIKRNILWGDPIKFFEDILKYEPNSARVNNNLGNLYFNQGNIEKAEAFYRKTIAAGDVFAQPHYNIGNILKSRGDFKGAIAEFEKAIAVDPDFTYSYQSLAMLYAQKGDLVKAVEYLEQLKKLLPQYSRVYYNLALVYVARGDYKSALDNLSKGLTLTDADPEAKALMERLLSELTKK